jgi:hypothetical protein
MANDEFADFSAAPQDEFAGFSPAQAVGKTTPKLFDPTQGMSDSDKFVAGVGKSLVDTGRGIRQLLASVPSEGDESPDMNSQDTAINNQLKTEADESKRLDAPLMNTGAGMAGNIAGGVAQIAAAPESIVAKAPLLSSIVSGAAFSGAQPVGTGESRTENSLLGGAAGAAGSVAGKVAGWVAQPIKKALSAAQQNAVDVLTQRGVPLDLAQQSGSRVAQTLKNIIADNPIIGPSAFPEEQGNSFNRAALRTMGIADPSVTAADDSTLSAGKKQITDTLDAIGNRTKIKYDTQLETQLADIEREAPGQIPDSDLGPIRTNLNNILRGAASNNGEIPGDLYQKVRSNLGALSKDPKVAPVAGEIQDAIHAAFVRSTAPEDQEALAEATRQYRAMKQIEGAVDPATGNISPGTLINRINTSANRNQSLYGKGDQSLVELAKAAKLTLGARNPDSGTARRLAGMAAMGAVAGGADEALHGNPSEALKVGAIGAAAPWVGRQLVENPTLVKSAMGWNNSPVVKGAMDVARSGAAAAAPAAVNERNKIPRASGGRVDIDSLVNRLISRWKSAKRETDATTKPLLNQPDAAIIRALDIAQEHI